MHDAAGKEKTVEILPQIIDYYKNEGYEFKVIKNTSKEENNSNQSENNKDKQSKQYKKTSLENTNDVFYFLSILSFHFQKDSLVNSYM